MHPPHLGLSSLVFPTKTHSYKFVANFIQPTNPPPQIFQNGIALKSMETSAALGYPQAIDRRHHPLATNVKPNFHKTVSTTYRIYGKINIEEKNHTSN